MTWHLMIQFFRYLDLLSCWRPPIPYWAVSTEDARHLQPIWKPAYSRVQYITSIHYGGSLLLFNTGDSRSHVWENTRICLRIVVGEQCSAYPSVAELVATFALNSYMYTTLSHLHQVHPYVRICFRTLECQPAYKIIAYFKYAILNTIFNFFSVVDYDLIGVYYLR